MRNYFFLLMMFLSSSLFAQETEKMFLSGTDKDNTVEWDFFCTKGARSGEWTKIAVPSCWELQGFGTYNYGHDRPHADEQGLYKYRFKVPKTWAKKRVYIIFEGSMTDTEVKINGQLAGEPHQGAFYPFRYDITQLLQKGKENLLEVTVSKESSNESVNRAERQADYWIFGGIFRPVYLEAVPEQHIERVAIDARANGDFNMNVFFAEGMTGSSRVQTDIIDLATKQKVATIEGGEKVTGHVANVKPWSQETPNRYEAVVRLMNGNKATHIYHQKFGFRTIEFRAKDGLYLNGEKIIFKGVCRHTFWPESGRTSSPALAIEDINLMKDMNMNAVRMSHYPPDTYFLDACDSIGMLVIDELAGWQKKYDTEIARPLVKAMVTRDVNHPSIVLWSNSNEGGFNFDVRPDYGLHDPQHRKLVEPWSSYDGIDTNHYPTYARVKERLEKGEDVYFPTEFIHGLYDGGHGAGLEDYWNLMMSYPTSAGGFLWDFADEGVVRHDKNDSIDCDALHAPDGILGPHHEKEGSFYTIKDVWSPIQMTFKDGTVTVSNHYMFTNLNQCRIEYEMVRYANPLFSMEEERVQDYYDAPSLSPGQSITFDLPDYDVPFDFIRVNLYDPNNRKINTWTLMISSTKELAQRIRAKNVLKEVAAIQDKVRLTVPGTLKWTTSDYGWLRLDYEYTLNGDYDYAGLTIDYPESDVEGAVLLADGPYHTWKNRLRGNQFGQYEKAYNNTITGQTWEYPEFKGYYSHFTGLRLKTKGQPLTIVTDTPGLYLHLFTPQNPVHRSKNTEPAFPEGNISILNCIPAIGNKFHAEKDTGPQGQKNHYDNVTFRGTVYFGLDK